MKKLFLQSSLILLKLCFCQPLVAGEILVIVATDSSITTLNSRELQRIYRRKTQINKFGERWVPINLGISNPLRIAFSKKIFKQHPENMEDFWNIQYFKGISPPYVVSSEEAVIRFVSNMPGSVGYINSCHLDPRVRVVMKLTSTNKLQNSCKPAMGNKE